MTASERRTTGEELRPAARGDVGALAVAAILLVAGASIEAGPVDRMDLLMAAVVGCTALAWRFPIPFGPRTKLYADTAATAAAVLLLPPGLASLAVALGALATQRS